MGSSREYFEMVDGLGVYDDCPLCGYSFPGCQGLCIAHCAANGEPGPFHRHFNDDCPQCSVRLTPYGAARLSSQLHELRIFAAGVGEWLGEPEAIRLAVIFYRAECAVLDLVGSR